MTKKLFILTLSILALTSVYAQDEFIEERPRYRSKEDRGHYNLRDLTGKRWGVWKIYNRNRVLISEIEYERGRKNGVYIKYNGTTGKPVLIKNYVHGKLDGAYEKYTALGELLVEGEYLLGKKTGVWTYSFPNGTVRKTGAYVNNLKEGKWEFYNRKEDLIRTIVYKKGVDSQAAAAEASAKAKADSTKNAKKGKKVKRKVVKKKSGGGAAPAAPASSPATTPASN